MCDRYDRVSLTPIPPEPPNWPSPPPGMQAKALRYYDFRDYFGQDHRRLVSMQGNCPRINVRQTVRSKRVVEKLQELWRPKRPVHHNNDNDDYSDEHEDERNDDDGVNHNGVLSKVDKYSCGRLVPYFEYGFNRRPPSRPRHHYYYKGNRRRADLYRPAYVDDSPRSDSDADEVFDSPIYDSSHDDSSCSSPATLLPPHPYHDRDYSGFSDCEDEEDEFSCENCSLSFDSHDAVEDHMDEEDHWAPRYGCEMCERKYLSLEAVSKHMDALKHRVPRYICETCPSQYATLLAAQQHMDLSDHWKQVIRCEPCGLDFPHEKDLKTVRNDSSSRFLKNSSVLHHMSVEDGWVKKMSSFICTLAFANKLIFFHPLFFPSLFPFFLLRLINSIMNPTYIGATKFAAFSVEEDSSLPQALPTISNPIPAASPLTLIAPPSSS